MVRINGLLIMRVNGDYCQVRRITTVYDEIIQHGFKLFLDRIYRI
ncbi:MAG: hypothetical protein JETCAE04_10060 [Candidatus Jettenia caeni]|nr:MAG: hypothetical protein JETCAE04_10060 [Candidatus Jettenia caeni]